MTTNDHGARMSDSLVITSTAFTQSVDRRPDHDHGNPGPWARSNRPAAWLEIARALPANLGVEFTAEHGWRIITVGVETRRALELLDITEGETLPDPVMVERRRRNVEARLMLDQALNVLRAEQVTHEARAGRRVA